MNLSTELGRGTIGIVYKATDVKAGHVVAAKRISLETNNKVATQDIAKLYDVTWTQRNIVSVLKVYWDISNLWIFMDYCESGNLEEYFQNNFMEMNNMKPKLDVMQQIANGVRYMHLNEIVHRDIKPKNILVTSVLIPRQAVIKLSDFDLNRYVRPDGFKWPMGECQFRSPEFWVYLSNNEDIHVVNDDIFSLGLVYLAMLEARKGHGLIPDPESPFIPPGYVMYKQRNAPGQKQGQIQPKLVNITSEDDIQTKGVKLLIQEMTSYKPTDRPNAKTVLHILTNDEELIQFGNVGITLLL